MFWMRRLLEVFLKMHKRAGCLDQSFEKNRIARFHLEPDVLEHIVRFVVTLVVPAAKVSAIKRVFLYRYGGKIDIFAFELAHES